MSAQYQAVIAGAFVDFLDQGYVYKGLKPVNWCINDRTALAEAEVEYENHTSPSIWVRFALTSDPAKIDPALAGRKVYGLIWTTTPWTIPANMAIAFHPKFEYVGGRRRGRRLHRRRAICSKATAEKLRLDRLPKSSPTFPGATLEGAVFRHPFLERDSLGILADHVTLEQGTGAVHTAPGHGQEDYVVGAAVRHRDLLPGRCRGPLLPRRRRRRARCPRSSSARRSGKPTRSSSSILKRAGALLGAEEDRAQLSALLALPQPDHLPRHRAVVHRHGAQRPARSARSKRSAA